MDSTVSCSVDFRAASTKVRMQGRSHSADNPIRNFCSFWRLNACTREIARWLCSTALLASFSKILPASVNRMPRRETVKELRLQAGHDVVDLPGQRRLCDVASFCGTREAAFLSNRKEVPHLT
jgi:hypothetical protein